MRSAMDNSQVVQDYLSTEIKEGRIIGPLDPGEYQSIHTNKFGVIPKSILGKWRLIVDMSVPEVMGYGVSPAHYRMPRWPTPTLAG